MLEISLIIILLISLFYYIVRYYNLKYNIRSVNRKIKRLINVDTNALIYSSTQDKDLIENINLFNNNLSSMNKLKQEIIHEENELRNTITNLSHDLRTPITSILGYTQLLKDQNNLTEKQYEYIQVIESRMLILKTLLEELFNYSIILEKEKLNLKEENITPILEESLVLFYDDLKDKNIVVTVHLLEKPNMKYIDKISLKRVFMNIINNALKYGVGSLLILEQEDNIIFENRTNKIDSIDVEKLFNRFFTVAKSRTNNSIGLGLTIARILMEKMGGTISAEVENDLFRIIINFK